MEVFEAVSGEEYNSIFLQFPLECEKYLGGLAEPVATNLYSLKTQKYFYLNKVSFLAKTAKQLKCECNNQSTENVDKSVDEG